VIDAATVKRWIEKLGYDAASEGKGTLRLQRRNEVASLPPFFVQCSENWILLSMLPVFGAGDLLPDDLPRRLLTVNRDMRIVKFALEQDDEVVLCAELPTESLQYAELADAVTRLVEYYRHYRDYLLRP
jgi:hypothetical protein